MRRIIYNSSEVSVSNGDQVQMQSNSKGGLLVAQAGGSLIEAVTPVLDTAIYAAGDTLFDTTEVAGASRVQGAPVKLTSITLLDEDDQGVACELYILGASGTFGAINAAPSITDTVARNVQGHVAVAAGDWKDLGLNRVACLENLNIICKPASGSTSLYIAATTGGTPTHTASGIKIKLGFEAV